MLNSISRRNIKEVKYEDLTKITNQKSTEIKNIDRKLKHSIDSEGNIHIECYFEKMKKERINEEKKYRSILESKLNHKVYRNPKPIIKNKKSPDYYVEDINELWDVKGIDGKSKNLIENIFGNICKTKLTSNAILVQRKTPFDINKLKSDVIHMFKNKKKTFVKQIMLFDDKDNLILYLKRK